MEWLFERMIELAAWVAFILGLVFLFDAGFLLVQWARAYMTEADGPGRLLLIDAGKAAASFVVAALAMGTLACIDRYVFDMPEPPAKA